MNPIMTQIWAFVCSHPIGFLVGFGYNTICMFNAMAPPGTDGGGFYGWLYRYGHLLISSPAAVWIEARASNLPVSRAVAAVTTTTVSHVEEPK